MAAKERVLQGGQRGDYMTGKKSVQGKELLNLLQDADKIVSAVAALAKTVEPLVKPALDALDTDAIAEAAKKAADAAADVADKTKSAFKDAANVVAGVADKAVAAKDKVFDDSARKKAAKQLKKAVKEVRQTVLENATTKITVADMLKAKAETGGFGPINSMPGCFVIATYKKLDFDKDLTDYTGLYVGKADNASEGVALAISRDGDPDVYADVKYNQNVHVYVYNCLPEDLEEQYHDLCQTFSDVVIPEAIDA